MIPLCHLLLIAFDEMQDVSVTEEIFFGGMIPCPQENRTQYKPYSGMILKTKIPAKSQ